MKPKIIVAGSSNTDMVVKVPHIPAPGETILGDDFMTIPGGKGANQAVAACRSGSDVVFIACISDDAFGKQALENYRKEGIDVSCIKVKPGIHSGIALINVAAGGENSISVAPGANWYILPEDIRHCRQVFSGAHVVLAQLEIPLKTVEAVADMAASENIPFILNPAPAVTLPKHLLKKVDIITPNESEAALLTSRSHFSEKDIPAMATEIYEMGVETVIITLGSKGVWLKSSAYEEMIPGYKVNAIDTTAAGDVFNGTLASALAQGKPLKEAIGFAQRAAALSVTRMGAQPSAPGLKEIEDFYSK